MNCTFTTFIAPISAHHRPGAGASGPDRPRDQVGHSRTSSRRADNLLHQPVRHLPHWRTPRRRRTHWTQDYRWHVRFTLSLLGFTLETDCSCGIMFLMLCCSKYVIRTFHTLSTRILIEPGVWSFMFLMLCCLKLKTCMFHDSLNWILYEPLMFRIGFFLPWLIWIMVL